MMTASKERPILFSGPMVRAILEGRKTQTRRVMKVQPTSPPVITQMLLWVKNCVTAIWPSDNPNPETGRHDDKFCTCPYGKPGDHIWVRESFCQKCEDGHFVYNADNNLDSSCCWYRADGTEVRKDDGDGGTQFNKDGSLASPWAPSIHMPRWASRITLEITGVRVERLNEISEEDSYSEGVTIPSHLAFVSLGNPHLRNEARCEFHKLWESINGDGSWLINPWVWVIEFKRITP